MGFLKYNFDFVDVSTINVVITVCFGRFLIGFFLGGIPWYVGTFVVLCVRVDYREKPGYVACAIAVSRLLFVVCEWLFSLQSWLFVW